MKKFKISPNERKDQLYDRWREHEAAREKEQREKAQKAANELLNSAPTFTEYCKRREAHLTASMTSRHRSLTSLRATLS